MTIKGVVKICASFQKANCYKKKSQKYVISKTFSPKLMILNGKQKLEFCTGSNNVVKKYVKKFIRKSQ